MWASAFSGIRVALRGFSPGHLAASRFIFASLTLAVCAFIWGIKRPELKEWPAFIALGLLGITIYHLALNHGEKTVGAGAASLLTNTIPIFVAILSTFSSSIRLKKYEWVGIILGFGGAVLIAFGEAGGLRFEKGAALILLASFSQSLYYAFQKPILHKHGPLSFACWTVWSGTVLLLLSAGNGLINAVQTAPRSSLLATLYLGVFPAGLATVVFSRVMDELPAHQAAAYIYLVPILAVLIGWLWLKEVPCGLTILGGVIALAGVALVNFKRFKIVRVTTGSVAMPRA